LEYGADVNAMNKQRETPLHEVAGRGHKEIVTTLLFFGADPTLKDSRGRTVLDVAIESSSTAAEGEVEALREKFIELGVALPLITENVDIKLEEADEIPEIIAALRQEFPEEPEGPENDTIANGLISTSPREASPLDTPTPPADDVTGSPAFTLNNDANSVPARTPTPIESSIPISIDEIIEQDEPATIVETIQVQLPLEMEVDEREPQRLSSPVPVMVVPSPIRDDKTAIEFSNDTIDETSPDEVHLSVPPLDSQDIELMPLAPYHEIADEKVDESLPEEARQPLVAPPEPRWTKLISVESLPKSLEMEISQLLPIYTMQFQDVAAEPQIYVTHTQVCSLLGFSSGEFFDKCTHLRQNFLI
jgi:hypothetical protein